MRKEPRYTEVTERTDDEARTPLADDMDAGSCTMVDDWQRAADDQIRPRDSNFQLFGKKLKRLFRTAYKIISSSVGLLLLLAAYSFIGAYIIRAVESPNELAEQELVKEKRMNIVTSLGSLSSQHLKGSINQTTFEALVEQLVLGYEEDLGVSSQTKWTFWGSLFFCGTIYTTIGYGHIAPVTSAGRVVTMVYAAFGIPLALVVLADLGRQLTVAIKFLWSFVLRFYYTGCCRRRGKQGRYKFTKKERNVNAVTLKHNFDDGPVEHNANATTVEHNANATTVEHNANATTVEHNANATTVEHNANATTVEHNANATTVEHNANVTTVVQNANATTVEHNANATTVVQNAAALREENATVKHNTDDVTWEKNRFSENVSDLENGTGNSKEAGNGTEEDDNENDYEVDSRFNLPFIVAIAIVVVYIILGSFMYLLWEDSWDFLRSFYFIFISISTIGFGDVIPEHPKFFLLSSIYIFIGLSLVSMCVNVAIEVFAKTIDIAKEKVDLAKHKAKTKAIEKIEVVGKTLDRAKDAGKEKIHDVGGKLDKAKLRMSQFGKHGKKSSLDSDSVDDSDSVQSGQLHAVLGGAGDS